MFSKTARYYDLVYGFKDYADETNKIAALIRKEHPEAKTILDVACGTAEHAKYLSKSFRIDGIDLEPEFVKIAREKNPTMRIEVADMSDFDLGAGYDVVQCLFSSIGYLLEPEQVVAALECFREHLNPGGVILVEPWLTPEDYKVGIPHMITVEKPEVKIARINTTGREGNLSKMRFHYVVGTGEGVEHFTEDHVLALYTVDEMTGCFEKAGLAVRHDPEGNFGAGDIHWEGGGSANWESVVAMTVELVPPSARYRGRLAAGSDGQGLGAEVISRGLRFGKERFDCDRFRVTIAAFNARALRVCRKLGFCQKQRFRRDSDGMEFVVLTNEIRSWDR